MAEASRKFPCGRPHVVVNSVEFDEMSMNKNPFLNESKLGESVNGQSSSYGLRENPKKTWRAVDANVCKQCGKGFQSMKALCGHMASHSDKDKGSGDHDHSWTNENQKMVLDGQSDTETEEMRLRTRSSKSRKCKKISDDYVLASNGGSSVSEIDGQEQEEVAKCLMMLSRDSGSKNSVSDNNSVVVSSSTEMKVDRVEKNEPSKLGNGKIEEDSDSGYFLDECASDVSVGWFRRHDYDVDDDDGTGSKIESRKRRNDGYENQEPARKYECFNCKKVFKSYQALGGHRPCNKRICESHDESGENSPAYYRANTKFVETKPSAKNSAEKKNKSKNKVHACPFCDRVFKNGQALGGHKRSHFLTGHVENRASPVEKADLLDLNIPAPEVDD